VFLFTTIIRVAIKFFSGIGRALIHTGADNRAAYGRINSIAVTKPASSDVARRAMWPRYPMATSLTH
jgi:hypothetical protein